MRRFLLFLLCVVLCAFLLAALLPLFGLSLALSLYYGWIIFAFIHYRQVRRQEVLHLLTTAIETQAPLAPTLYAYLLDRSRSPWRSFWNLLVLLLVFTPVLIVPAYLIWRRHNFDQKVYRVARRLDQGYSLHEALSSVSGVVSRETLLAVAVGQQTGELARCLNNVPRWQMQSAALELVPRVLYPLTLLPIFAAIVSFQLVFIVPKFEKIFSDFGMRLPEISLLLIQGSRVFVQYWFLIVIPPAVIMAAALFFSLGAACWHLPVIGRLYRMRVQSRILSMLAILLDAGKPLPEALRILSDSGYLPAVVQRRLDAVRRAIELGEPLPSNLLAQGLLPASMAPLLQAAERSRHSVWVLGEMGMTLSGRMVRLSQRITLAVFPIVIFALGLLVGIFAVGMFLPLVELMTQLTQL